MSLLKLVLKRLWLSFCLTTLPPFSLSLSPLLFLSPLMLGSGEQAAMLWVVMQKDKHTRELISPSNSEKWSKACQQPLQWKWSGSFLSLASCRLQAQQTPRLQPCVWPWTRNTQLTPAWTPDPQKLRDNKCILF